MPDLPGRLEFWNVGYPLLGALVYLTILIATAAIAYGAYQRYRVYRLGRPMPDLGPWRRRLDSSSRLAFLDVFGHRRFLKRELYPGLMHLFLFWGMLWLLIATTVTALEFNWHSYAAPTLRFEFPTAYARPYTGLLWDLLGGGLLSAGLLMAILRRYVLRPPRLNTFIDDAVILGLLAALTVTGFLIEGLRIASTTLNPQSTLYDPAIAPWEPIGYLVALALRGLGLTPAAGEMTHFALYWLHVLIYAAGFVYIAVSFSKLSHIFVSPVNAFLRSDRPLGALRPMGDIETLERFGAADVTDLTWKQVLDFDACTNCGRCQDQCPAYASGKPLSPRKLIQDLRLYTQTRAPALLAATSGQEPPPPQTSMIDAVSEDVLWSCTTCRACMEACPVFIEHVDTIVDMRRYLVMEQASMPDTAQNALLSMEQRGHPWRGTTYSRTDWAQGMDVNTIAQDPNVDVLLWVGCTGALEQRSQAVPRALASILKVAGVKFAILGDEETCTGDPARRMGNEYLFQLLAQQNIETLRRHNVRRIVTPCPPLLQHPPQRVPPAWRRVRGHARHPVRQRAHRPGPHPPPPHHPDHPRLPRLLLPRPPQRRLRPAPRHRTRHPRRRPRRNGPPPPGARLLLRRRRRTHVDGRSRPPRQPHPHRPLPRHRRPDRRRLLPLLPPDAHRGHQRQGPRRPAPGQGPPGAPRRQPHREPQPPILIPPKDERRGPGSRSW